MKAIRDKLLENKEYAIEAAKGDLIMDVTESICAALESQKLNRQSLADKLGKTKGYVSQVLNGNRNMTLATLAEMAFALDLIPAFKMVPKNEDFETAEKMEQ